MNKYERTQPQKDERSSHNHDAAKVAILVKETMNSRLPIRDNIPIAQHVEQEVKFTFYSYNIPAPAAHSLPKL